MMQNGYVWIQPCDTLLAGEQTNATGTALTEPPRITTLSGNEPVAVTGGP